jgi:hypothetical protein
MFDNTTENPELIWNETSRKLVIQTIRELLFDLLQKQIEDPNTKWNAVSRSAAFLIFVLALRPK